MKTLFTVLILLIPSFIVNAEKPNLIIIQTDEHNFRTIGSYRNLMTKEQAEIWGEGVVVNTPNIDSIASNGAIANKFYASSPVCTPSRASLITGLYPHATGAPKNGLHISKNVKTFAHILKEQGYSTSYVGKWHLDGNRKYQFDIKYNAGFTDNEYMMSGGHAPYFQITKHGVKGINEKKFKKIPKNETIHVTDYFTNKALHILERDKNKPFALMLSIPDPHTPDVAKSPYDTMFNSLKPKAPRTMSSELNALKPSWGRDKTKNEAKEFDGNKLKQYFGMIKHIDDSVGRILTFLDDNNLTDKTIVVFTADHGDMYFEHNRLNKSVPYEAAAKVPFVIRYPQKIPAGKVINKAYTTVDFTPTILGLMDIKTNVEFHGLNAVQDFTNEDKNIVDNRITYYAKSHSWWVAAVDNRYKLILDKKEKPWLFDLQEDPDELTNLYNSLKHKNIATKLKTALFKQMKKFKDPGLNKKSPYLL